MRRLDTNIALSLRSSLYLGAMTHQISKNHRIPILPSVLEISLKIELGLNLLARPILWPDISVSLSLSLHISKSDSAHDLVSMERFTSISWENLP
jgi:hypothetical protein